MSYLPERTEREASILRTEQRRKPGTTTCRCAGILLSARLPRSEEAKNASCSFISSALRRRRRGTRGVPPFVCNSACVCLEQERGEKRERGRKRERERYEGKTDRTRGAGDSRFWTRFGDRSCPTARVAHGKNNINRTYFASTLPSRISLSSYSYYFGEFFF